MRPQIKKARPPQARVLEASDMDHSSQMPLGNSFDKPGFKAHKGASLSGVLLLAAAAGAFAFGLARELFF